MMASQMHQVVASTCIHCADSDCSSLCAGSDCSLLYAGLASCIEILLEQPHHACRSEALQVMTTLMLSALDFDAVTNLLTGRLVETMSYAHQDISDKTYRACVRLLKDMQSREMSGKLLQNYKSPCQSYSDVALQLGQVHAYCKQICPYKNDIDWHKLCSAEKCSALQQSSWHSSPSWLSTSLKHDSLGLQCRAACR